MPRPVALLLIISILTGCGGSSGPVEQENPDPPPGLKPKADGNSKKGLGANRLQPGLLSALPLPGDC